MMQTIGDVFRQSVEADKQQMISILSSLPEGQGYSALFTNTDDKPIKGYAITRREGQFYASFAKTLFDTKAGFAAQDSYKVDAFADIIRMPAVFFKRSLETFNDGSEPRELIGPMNLQQTLTLLKAVTYVNTAREFESQGQRIAGTLGLNG